MGYKYNSKNIRCPLFVGVVKTTNGQFIGIECEPLKINLGFDIIFALSLKNDEDLKEYTKLYCKGNYENCHYYKAYDEIACKYQSH